MDQEEPYDYIVEPLTADHDVSRFDCQNTAINLFLRENALELIRRDLARTFVVLIPSESRTEPIGFFTLRAESYYATDQPHVPSIPVAELMFLARDIRYYGAQVGTFLLFEAFHKIKEAADRLAIVGLQLFHTNDGKKLYDRYKFSLHPDPNYNHLLFLPIATIREMVSEGEAEAEE